MDSEQATTLRNAKSAVIAKAQEDKGQSQGRPGTTLRNTTSAVIAPKPRYKARVHGLRNRIESQPKPRHEGQEQKQGTARKTLRKTISTIHATDAWGQKCSEK